MDRAEREQILEDELLIVRHSGEIPEIAYHATIHYLQEDPEGPGLTLNRAEITSLQDAALKRAREIVLRDLDPANRDRSIYRGLKRSIHNWQRLHDFLRRLDRAEPDFATVVRKALLAFLQTEVGEVASGRPGSSVNCSAAELAAFALELGCTLDELPAGWQALCEEGER
jgi:hypothetical protein